MPILLWDVVQSNQIKNLEDQIRHQKNDVKFESVKETIRLNARLERKLNMLTLINRALFEILEEKLDIDMMELTAKVNEIDLRDGVKDGKLVKTAMDCPKCDAKVNRDFNRCLFCGYEPEEADPFDQIGN